MPAAGPLCLLWSVAAEEDECLEGGEGGATGEGSPLFVEGDCLEVKPTREDIREMKDGALRTEEVVELVSEKPS